MSDTRKVRAGRRCVDALRALLKKMGEPGGECDHPRRFCDDVGCCGKEVTAAVSALAEWESADAE